jgi:hypothetical protein
MTMNELFVAGDALELIAMQARALEEFIIDDLE